MKNIEATAEEIMEAEARMVRRRKSIEGSVKWLKDYLNDNMEACGIHYTGHGAAIDTTTAAGKPVFGIFAALAEFEQELIAEYTRAGLAAA